MNVLSEEARIAQNDRLSRSEIGTGDLPYRRPVRQRYRAVDLRPQQMRWIGLVLCLVSAAITLASATLIAIRF